MYNKLKADDIESGLENQVFRNLNFKSVVLEFGPVLEVIFSISSRAKSHNEPDFGSPYFDWYKLYENESKAKYGIHYMHATTQNRGSN